MVEKITGASLPSTYNFYSSGTRKQTGNIISPLHKLFHSLHFPRLYRAGQNKTRQTQLYFDFFQLISQNVNSIFIDSATSSCVLIECTYVLLLLNLPYTIYCFILFSFTYIHIFVLFYFFMYFVLIKTERDKNRRIQ